MQDQMKSEQWEQESVQEKVPEKKESEDPQPSQTNKSKREVTNKNESSSSQSDEGSNSSQSSDEEQEQLKADLPKKDEKDQEDEWGDDTNFENPVQKQKKPLMRGNQFNQEKSSEPQNNLNASNLEKPQRGNTNFQSNEQPQQVRVVNNFFGNRQDDEDQDNGFRNQGNGFSSRGRGRGGFRGGRGGFGGGNFGRDNLDSRGRGRGRGRGNFRGGYGNREGGFNSRGGDSNGFQGDTQGTFNQQQYNQNPQQFTPPSFNPTLQYNSQYVNPQDAFRKKSQGPIYVSNYQQPIQQIHSLHGSRVVNVPQPPTTMLNESLQMSMIRATDCDILEDEPEVKSEKGKISAQRKKWNLQKIKPEGRKAWPTMSIKILSKTLQVTYRRISEHSACIVVIPITDLIFNIYPGTIIHQSDINYKEILQSKWERIQSPGSVYIKESHLPKNFRFVGLAFIKISETEQSITNGLSRLFQSLREMARSQNKQSGLGNIVIPLSLFKDHQNKYQKFIIRISEMMEKKENDFINEISLTTKDPSEYQQALNVFTKLTLKMIKNFEICVDQ